MISLKEEIKEILDRLERIDHKEYIAFEFADSATFEEMARCFEERKKMADYITNLQEENERLKKNKPYSYTDTNWDDLLEYNGMKWINYDRYKELKDSSPLDEAFYNGVYKLEQDYKSRIDKAIEYIDKLWSFPGGNYEIAINERDSIDIDGNDYFDNLLNILQGEDK